MHPARSFRAAAALVAVLAVPAAARAQDKASIKDRFEQIVATFMGDPAAGVDIDMKHVLDRWRDMKPKPFEDLTAADARRQPTPIEAAKSLLADEGKTLDPYKIDHRDVTFPGPDGELKARVYTPEGGDDGGAGKKRPLVVFFHGGGFVLDNTASTHATSRAIAGGADVVVFAPDYRLAPEHKFPAAPDDALAAYKWAIANAASLGGDPDEIALAGEGAGAMLAVDTAIAARDAHLPKAKALVLITPAAGINLKTNSWIEDSTARPWNLKAVEWAIRQYLPSPDAKYDPRVDLVGAADVDGLPPTTIVTAEDDPLRSDGERLGGKLKRATVPVQERDFPGVTHDFFGMGAAVDKAEQAQRFVDDQLKDAFAPSGNAALALQQMGVAPYPEAPDPAVDAQPSAAASSLPGEGAKMQGKGQRK